MTKSSYFQGWGIPLHFHKTLDLFGEGKRERGEQGECGGYLNLCSLLFPNKLRRISSLKKTKKTEKNGFGCLGLRIFNDGEFHCICTKTLDLFGEGEKGEGRGGEKSEWGYLNFCKVDADTLLVRQIA